MEWWSKEPLISIDSYDGDILICLVYLDGPGKESRNNKKGKGKCFCKESSFETENLGRIPENKS